MFIHTIKKKIADSYHWNRYRDAQRAYNEAVPYRHYLPDSMFDEFVKKHASVPIDRAQDYSKEGLDKMSSDRAELVWNNIKGSGVGNAVLEIGPGTGHLLKKLKEGGFKRALAVDIIDMRADDVKQAGVESLMTSAEDMSAIPDASFDLIISWNAMEHIPNPEKVFNECKRILAPGGFMFWSFGPLYYSPWGYHQVALKVPYLQLLFPEKMIHDYAKEHGKFGGYIPWTNGRGLDGYEFLKKPLPYGYKLASYKTGFDIYCSDMIIKYPEIFKSKNVPFESFFTDWLEISFWKKWQ